MVDLTYRREQTEEVLDYSVEVSKFENGAEQRRLIHDRPLLGFKITMPPNNYTKAKEIRDFFVSKYGALTPFTFLNPHDGEEYTVRFEPGSYSSNLTGGAYVVQFQLTIVL